MADSDKPVLVSDAGAVRTIALNRPDVLNAFNDAMLADLTEAVADAREDSSVRCVVITGSGRAFCSGLDLGYLVQRRSTGDPIDFNVLLRDQFNPIVLHLRTMDKPVIASVNGVAAGAGASTALVCDMRIAGESASFMQAFVHVGLVPDAGSTFMLPRLVGLARAMELACTGRKVEAGEALQMGLVNQVVTDEELPAATQTLAQRLASLPTRAIGFTKRAINAAGTADLATQLDYEAVLQVTAAQTHDHREGVAAFFEKRKPVFKGC